MLILAATKKKIIPHANHFFHALSSIANWEEAPQYYWPANEDTHFHELMNKGQHYAKQLGVHDVYSKLYKSIKDQDGVAYDKHLETLSTGLHEASKKSGISDEEKKHLKDFGSYFGDGNTRALNRIKSALGETYTPFKAAKPPIRFTPEESQHARKKQLQLSKKMTGKNELLTREDSAKLGPKHTETLKEYRKFGGIVNKAFKQGVNDLLAEKKADHLPHKEVLDTLKRRGYVRTNHIPEGFDGRVGKEGVLYTHHGEEIIGKPNFPVKMNPHYKKGSGSYVFKSVPPEGMGGPQQYKTKMAHGDSIQDKFDRLPEVEKHLPKALDNIQKSLASGELSKENTTKALIGALYHTKGRIGTAGNATAGQSTYGISTLQGRHVTSGPEGLNFTYRGKEGKTYTHTIPHSTMGGHLTRYVKKLIAGKGKKDYIFSHNGGKSPVTNSRANEMMEDGLHLPMTVHGFRRHHATSIMNHHLENHPWKGKSKNPTQKSVDSWMDGVAKGIGKQLGHTTNKKGRAVTTGNTALMNYIDPRPIHKFYTSRGLTPPKTVSVLMGRLKEKSK